MKEILRTFPSRFIPIVISFFANALLLLVCAILIETSAVSPESADILIIISLVLSALVGSIITVVRFGTKLDGYIFAGIYLSLLLTMAFMHQSGSDSNSMLIKLVISVLSGTIIGNLFGSRKHYKLRNRGKVAARPTK